MGRNIAHLVLRQSERFVSNLSSTESVETATCFGEIPLNEGGFLNRFICVRVCADIAADNFPQGDEDENVQYSYRPQFVFFAFLAR